MSGASRVTTARNSNSASLLERPAHRGVHLAEWSAEFLGTLLLVLGGLSAVTLDFAPHSPVVGAIHSPGVRLALAGILFAGTGSLVAISPLGRLSGAHLNPAVSLAFYLDGKLAPGDLLGYILAQLLGALTGAAILRLLWGTWARAVAGGATAPKHGVGAGGTLALETLLTATLLLALFISLSSRRTVRMTPLVSWVTVASFVRLFGRWGGPSMNPARSLGPAVLFSRVDALWPYLLGPLAGACGCALIWRFVITEREVLTAKLFHDPHYRSVLGGRLPSQPAEGPLRRVS